MSNLKNKLQKIARSGLGLKFIMCEDWFIYAYDRKNGDIYFLNTETSGIWLDIAKEKGVEMEDIYSEPDAVEKYILPEVKKDWNDQNWEKSEYTVWNMWDDTSDLKSIFTKYDIELSTNEKTSNIMEESINTINLKNKLQKTSNTSEIRQRLYDIVNEAITKKAQEIGWTDGADGVLELVDEYLNIEFGYNIANIATKINGAIEQWAKDTKENYPEGFKDN